MEAQLAADLRAVADAPKHAEENMETTIVVAYREINNSGDYDAAQKKFDGTWAINIFQWEERDKLTAAIKGYKKDLKVETAALGKADKAVGQAQKAFDAADGAAVLGEHHHELPRRRRVVARRVEDAHRPPHRLLPDGSFGGMRSRHSLSASSSPSFW